MPSLLSKLKENKNQLKNMSPVHKRCLIQAATEAASLYEPGYNPSYSAMNLQAKLLGKFTNIYQKNTDFYFPKNDDEKLNAILHYMNSVSCEGSLANLISNAVEAAMSLDKSFANVIEETTDPYYSRFPSPDGHLSSTKWALKVLNLPFSVLDVGRKKIALFEEFRPEYADYYRALQQEIARKCPEEQDRPLICLQILGYAESDTKKNTSVHAKYVFNVGMAGGTGPLSDASALESIMLSKAGIKHGNLDFNRELVKENLKNMSVVLYSMPPPRDVKHLYYDFTQYRTLYAKVREDMSCKSLHILTNTGHSNKWFFENSWLFGRKNLGEVNDMTIKVADWIRRQTKPRDNVLILGTLAADKARLYPNLLSARGLTPHLPAANEDKQRLQTIINQAKTGNMNKPVSSGSTQTWGMEFIDFVIKQTKATNSRHLLFSCTELPMLLHTELTGSTAHDTYFDVLKQKLGEGYYFYDSEEKFVDIIDTLESQHASFKLGKLS